MHLFISVLSLVMLVAFLIFVIIFLIKLYQKTHPNREFYYALIPIIILTSLIVIHTWLTSQQAHKQKIVYDYQQEQARAAEQLAQWKNKQAHFDQAVQQLASDYQIDLAYTIRDHEGQILNHYQGDKLMNKASTFKPLLATTALLAHPDPASQDPLKALINPMIIYSDNSSIETLMVQSGGFLEFYQQASQMGYPAIAQLTPEGDSGTTSNELSQFYFDLDHDKWLQGQEKAYLMDLLARSEEPIPFLHHEDLDYYNKYDLLDDGRGTYNEAGILELASQKRYYIAFLTEGWLSQNKTEQTDEFFKQLDKLICQYLYEGEADEKQMD